MHTQETEEAAVANTDETKEPAQASERAPERTTVTSRRGFLTMGAAAAAILGVRQAEAQTKSPRGRYLKPITPPLPGPYDASTQWKDPILRLVRRITMGLNPADVTRARQLGYSGYLNYQLAASGIDDSATDTFTATNYPLLSMTYQQLVAQDLGEVNAQLADHALYRAAFSSRQLKERMVDFWTDHFTVDLDKVGPRKAVEDRDVIRTYAMTNFPDLLRATSKSAGMLVSLDQQSSRKPTPNQNYAREIMELHTLGVDKGYSQTDVAELSRILTGFSINGTTGAFLFQRTYHDIGAKVFLGRAFPAMLSTATTQVMQKEGEDAIDMLVNSSYCAQFISLKMARWLLAYEPPTAVVNATAAVYLATGGDITAMIRAILTRDNLMAAPAKLKRPFHYAASGLRALGATVVNVRSMRQNADLMGMPMYMWPQPNGYPDYVDWWSGLVLQRWQFATTLSNQSSATTTNVNLTPFKAQGVNATGVVKMINTNMFGGELTVAQQLQLSNYVGSGTPSDTKIRETLSLAMGSEQFQWY